MSKINDTFLQLALGGAAWVLWLLVAMSVVSAVVIIERALHYRALARRERLLASARTSELPRLSLGLDTPGARLYQRVATEVSEGTPALAMAVESTHAVERGRLEKNLAVLGTIGANAPFVGLLGTVLEILRVFHLLGDTTVASSRGVNAIMTGLSEALVATAVGLVVAIPATVAYNAFLRRVGLLLGEAQETATRGLALAQAEVA